MVVVVVLVGRVVIPTADIDDIINMMTTMMSIVIVKSGRGGMVYGIYYFLCLVFPKDYFEPEFSLCSYYYYYDDDDYCCYFYC